MDAWIEQQQVVNWSASRPATLPASELHVWWLSLRQPAERYARFQSLLSERERQRAARFKFERHRIGFTAGRGLLRELLGHYLQSDPAALRFHLGPLGKPSLAPIGDRQLCFNYSDAEDRALYAFAWDLEVGADLECLQRQVAHHRIIARKFTTPEADTLLSLPEQQQAAAFLVCWTRKEGYGKARGVGIRYPLDSVEMCRDCRSQRIEVPDPEVGHWVVNQIYPSEQYTGTIVHAAAEPAIRFFTEPPQFP